MKYLFINVMLLAALCSGSAQISSHSQTMAPATAAKQPSPSMLVTGKAVARVNGTTLTDQDLLREMFAIFPYARQHNGFPKLQEAAIRQGALNMIVFEELVYQEAERRKMVAPPLKVDQAVAKFRKGFASPAEYKEFIQVEFKGSPQLLRQRIRRSLLIDALLKVEVKNKSGVLPAELKASYANDPKSFEVPESFAIQTISILPQTQHPTAEQLKDVRTRADDAVRQAKAAKSYEQFGLLAEKLSQDDFRVDMGKHKPTGRAELPPPVVLILDKMQVGQVSDLIQLDNAYTIVRLASHQAAGRKKFAEVNVSLAKILQKKKANQLRTDFDTRLHKNAKVELL